MNQVSEVAQRIVAVDGQGGAGKTTLASVLACALEAIGQRVDVVRFDDFFLPSALWPSGEGAEKPIGGDFDWQRLHSCDQFFDQVQYLDDRLACSLKVLD